MITTSDIAREDWVSFLDALSRSHVAEPVRVEVLRPELGAELEFIDLPLDGIGADLEGTSTAITVVAGTDRDHSIAHVVIDPVSLRVARGADGDDEALEIVSADRTITLVFFDGPPGGAATAG